MSESDRDGGGRYSPSVTDADILGILERASAPVMTATEIADELPIGRSAVRKRLVDLHGFTLRFGFGHFDVDPARLRAVARCDLELPPERFLVERVGDEDDVGFSSEKAELEMK